MAIYRYSRWDGTQAGFELDADGILSQIEDDLVYHGDIGSALRRMMQHGFEDRNGRHIEGLQELLERIRERRRQEREQHDLGGAYQEIAKELDEIVDQERRALDDLEEEARASGDQRRREVTDEAVGERRAKLGLLPEDLAGRVRGLTRYDFTSSEARERFEELVERLRGEVVQSYLDQVAGAASTMGPAEREHIRNALDALNKMMEQRAAGEALDPSFEQFMERYGDLFPGEPADLDELLEQLAQRMAAASAMLASMTPGQRAQLQGLMDELLGDMDLSWQVDRLAGNLRAAFPGEQWDRRMSFSGGEGLGLAETTDMFERLGQLDQLEAMLSGAPQPGALAEIDLERVRDLVGNEASAALAELQKLSRRLEEAGIAEQREGRLELTPKGLRHIGQRALEDLFKHLSKDRLGGHGLARIGTGHERAEDTKAYELGDQFNLHIERTMRNALSRQVAEGELVAGGRPGDRPAVRFPVRLSPDDFEVERTEQQTQCATVLLVDLSLSMPLRDNFLAAKKVALAMHALISGQFPRDYLGIIGFSEMAREIKPEELPVVSWDYVYGTNMQHALLLARRLLARHHGTRQIVMITDGEPTAHLLEDGEVFFSYPPMPATVEATLQEVLRCSREGIRINTFALDATGHLRHFVEKLTQLNRGRAFFTTPDTLGDYVLVDFIENRRQLARRRSGGA
jgi:uncharacterized protein with von Willebrand factor type A (vWA) domain